jgi:hypothetical protein
MYILNGSVIVELYKHDKSLLKKVRLKSDNSVDIEKGTIHRLIAARAY